MKNTILAFLCLALSTSLYGSSAHSNAAGGGGSSAWGGITGTLSSQGDLQAELDAKVNNTGNETVAGVKTFSSNMVLGASVSIAGNISSIKGVTTVWPEAQGAASTVLTNNGSGVLTWAAGGGGGISALAAIGSSPNANGATISGSNLNLEPASGSFGGVVTTGAQTLAGQKTLSSAPILSSLTAQAMPYLNASKVMSDGVWRQADTTGATTFTPAGSPSAALTYDLGSMSSFTTLRLITGAMPTGSGANLDYINTTVQSGTTAAKFLRRTGVTGGTMSDGAYLAGIYSDIDTTHSGKTLGALYDSGANGVIGNFQRVSGGTTGGGIAQTGCSYNSNYVIGGQFAGILPAGASPQSYGVRSYATGENSAQQVGGYFRIYTTQTSGNETANPGLSSALIADNGTTTHNIFTAMDNGSSVFQIQDGGAVIMGGNNTNPAHTLRGSMNGGSVFPTRFVNKVVQLADGASITLDPTQGNIFAVSISQQSSILPPTVCADGQKITIRIKASGANRLMGLHTGTAGAFRYGEDFSALTTTTSGKTDYVTAECNATDNRWDVQGYSKGY